MKHVIKVLLSVVWILLTISCSTEEDVLLNNASYETVMEIFPGTIDLYNLDNYAAQQIPEYITKDNTRNNPITDKGATLGRVLFYDKNLSVDGTISCASCHQQQHAFSDLEITSLGVNGNTGRHSMRLVNNRFSEETRFFWDERATTLEEQTTQPIQDHKEMGFSGIDGDPDLNDLIARLSDLEYYQELFTFTYGDSIISEVRIQNSLAQFIRSIQSFDSRFDEGRAQVNNNNVNFPNFSDQENLGKRLFLNAPNNGGAGCGGCHRAPEFDIDPNSLNNGIVTMIGSSELDLENTRAPSLRDLFGPDGQLNGVLMHSGEFASLDEVINHYDRIVIDNENTNLDPRLRAGGNGQNLNLSEEDKLAIVAFIKTLSGSNVYSDPKWSDPFN